MGNYTEYFEAMWGMNKQCSKDDCNDTFSYGPDDDSTKTIKINKDT